MFMCFDTIRLKIEKERNSGLKFEEKGKKNFSFYHFSVVLYIFERVSGLFWLLMF